MTLDPNNELFLVDKRISDRNISAGRISKEEFLKSIEELRDLEGQFDDISEEVFDEETTKVSVTGEVNKGDQEE